MKTNDNHIQLFFNCGKCCEENSSRMESMEEYSKISVGWTKKGLQVWCVRHDCNVVNLDFLGQKIDFVQPE